MSERILLRRIAVPVFQNKVYPSVESARSALTGDICLVQSDKSGLVYNVAFDPALLDYDSTYHNEQTFSTSFRDHLTQVCEMLTEHFGSRSIGIEIGCGKGYFLELMLARGADLTGFDPAYEGENPQIHSVYFDPRSLDKSPDYFILRHVLEHISDPWSYLATLRVAGAPGAKIYIEVPCFDWIVRHKAFYDVFYEHVNYFTLDVLRHSFGTVLDAGHLFGGQYIYIVAEISTFEPFSNSRAPLISELGIEPCIQELKSRRRWTGKPAFAWGAGAKGVTFTNAVMDRGILIEALLDINPLKQNKFAAGSGLAILNPVDLIPKLSRSDVFVMNSQYLSEIRSLLNGADANLIAIDQ